MPKCTFLVGVPASGKSTWLAEDRYGDTAWTISTDNIIQRLAEKVGMTYDEAFSDLIKFAEKVMWRNLEKAASLGENIVIDRTNLSVNSRKRFINFLQGYEFEAVVFPTPEAAEWRRRLESRPGKTIPAKILDSMAKSFVMPTEAEGFSKVTVFNAQ